MNVSRALCVKSYILIVLYIFGLIRSFSRFMWYVWGICMRKVTNTREISTVVGKISSLTNLE